MFRELYRTNKAGTETLIRIVSRIIHQIARRNLPLLVGEIRNMYRQAEAKKKSYPVIFEDDKSKYVELARIVDGITKDFSELTLEEKSSSECDGKILERMINFKKKWFWLKDSSRRVFMVCMHVPYMIHANFIHAW